MTYSELITALVAQPSPPGLVDREKIIGRIFDAANAAGHWPSDLRLLRDVSEPTLLLILGDLERAAQCRKVAR